MPRMGKLTVLVVLYVQTLPFLLVLNDAFRMRPPSIGLHRSSIERNAAFDSILERDSDGLCKFVFVGGKGGVGKTTSSTAIAVKLAGSGFRTLLVSTDPAHSLGDVLDVPLTMGKPSPVSTEANLWALEIDTEQSMEEFREAAAGFDAASLSSSLGVPKNMIDSLGLDDLASMFTNPPPGIDEIVGLSQIVKYGDPSAGDGGPKFDRIVIDTAPTGHTIRLLQLPTFVDSLAGNVIRFRMKISNAVSTFQSMFSSDSAPKTSTLDTALDRLELVQNNMEVVQSVLKDPSRTEFVVVAIPTSLAVLESRRLVSSLQAEQIEVGAVICNQVVSEDCGLQYLESKIRAQAAALTTLQRDIDLARITSDQIVPEITTVPYFETEIIGTYGLRFFANIAHPVKAKGSTNPIDSRKLSIFGGKGGVGKTTTSASWAVQLTDAGLNTLIVSTDPAHSLGDALGVALGGEPRLLSTGGIDEGGGQLWAMEIDPEKALEELKEMIGSTAEGMQNNDMAAGALGAMGLSGISGDLKSMMDSVMNPPPGTDEIVALAKVISYLEEGYLTCSGSLIKFDRIVLDTAPTGHTMRMLTLPDFLREFVRKVKVIRDKAGNIGLPQDRLTADGDKIDRLTKFERNMEKLEDMLHNPKETEFVVVTIPTEVAMQETRRLLASLRESSVFLRRVLVNQVLPELGSSEEARKTRAEEYLSNLRKNQGKALSDLENLSISTSVPLICVPFFETEIRNTYGLQFVGNLIFSQTRNL